MEDREKLDMDKYKEITNDWNYDASCTLTSLPVWDLENFKHLIFVAQSVHYTQSIGATSTICLSHYSLCTKLVTRRNCIKGFQSNSLRIMTMYVISPLSLEYLLMYGDLEDIHLHEAMAGHNPLPVSCPRSPVLWSWCEGSGDMSPCTVFCLSCHSSVDLQENCHFLHGQSWESETSYVKVTANATY
jgi:hypothetical protein